MAQVSVHGLKPCNKKDHYENKNPCEEFLTVEVNNKNVDVPITGVRKAVYDYRGSVPEEVTFSHLLVDGEDLHAETILPSGARVELYREHGWNWVMERFDADATQSGFKEVWSRPGAEEGELTALVNLGLSPAEALDYWMVVINDRTQKEWADERGLSSHQAVGENVRKAIKKLGN